MLFSATTAVVVVVVVVVAVVVVVGLLQQDLFLGVGRVEALKCVFEQFRPIFHSFAVAGSHTDQLQTFVVVVVFALFAQPPLDRGQGIQIQRWGVTQHSPTVFGHCLWGGMPSLWPFLFATLVVGGVVLLHGALGQFHAGGGQD